jgi:signal transduction histidine kinase
MPLNNIPTRRILIVDDDASSSSILSSFTRRIGLEPLVAETSSIALELLDDSIDLILLDIMMPDMDGLSLLSVIRSNDALSDIPVIMVTALSSVQARLAAVEAGANDFIIKPVDMTELQVRMRSLLRFKHARDELKRYHSQASLTSRLDAIGQLAAGIAHEINSPVQYVGDAVGFLHDSFEDLIRVVSFAEKDKSGQGLKNHGQHATMTELLQEIDADFLKEEIPRSFARILDGITRISSIVRAMKRFSYSGSGEKKRVNIVEAIENTLVISHSEWNYVADVVTDFDPGTPEILCFPGEINQVLLNIIINAAHAVADVVRGTENKGKIVIKTRKLDDHLEISIEDTGAGIPENIRGKVFNLFFTTKDVGKGTGQGLAISYDIVVNKHGGNITFESKQTLGTTFFIRLPIGEGL